jgi:hypothetical protein
MQESNLVSTPVVTPQVVAEKPKQNNFLVVLLSILLLISVSIAGFFAYQTQKLVKELNSLKSAPKVIPVANVEPTTEPVVTSSVSTVSATANWKTYTSNLYKLNLKYPSTWKISTKTIAMGEKVTEKNKYDEVATDSKVELVDLSNGSWDIRVSLRKTVAELGGQGPIRSLVDFNKIPVVGRTLLRTKVENGNMPFIANHPEPYPFPLFFQRLPNEKNPPSWPNIDSSSSYVTLFSVNSNTGVNIGITLYSDTLTKDNIENLKISSDTMKEIDQILSTFKFLD